MIHKELEAMSRIIDAMQAKIDSLELALNQCRATTEDVCCGATMQCLTCGGHKPCDCDHK